jgi:hypothetical protein
MNFPHNSLILSRDRNDSCRVVNMSVRNHPVTTVMMKGGQAVRYFVGIRIKDYGNLIVWKDLMQTNVIFYYLCE